MREELFPFQTMAVRDIRTKIAMAVENYTKTSVPQVISLQAPTGSGKTIIMASLVEEIFFGNEKFAEQPDAKGSNKYKVVGSTVIKGNKAFITWAKYQNNPYFCRPEKIR